MKHFHGDRLRFERKTTMQSTPRQRFWVSMVIGSLLLLVAACSSSASPPSTPTRRNPTPAPTSPTVPHVTYRGNSPQVITLDWSPDGKHIVSGDTNHFMKVWDSVTGKTLLTYQAPSEVWGVAWSPDGRRIAFAGGTFRRAGLDPTARVLDAKTGRTLLTYQRH